MSFRNRCRIVGAEGPLDLSIPLSGGRDQKTLTSQVRVAAGRHWQAQHWKTIVSCYSRSPWFDHYRDGLERLFQEPADGLVDWDLRCLEWSLRALGMPREIRLTERYREDYGPEEGVDWRGKLLPKNIAGWGKGNAGQVAGVGMGESGEGGLAPARYRQVFEERIGFVPNLSILDLLFCEGKEAIKYIRS